MNRLEQRVRRLEDKTVGRGRTLHVIDLSECPRDYDHDRAFNELGVEVKPGDLTVFLVDPTNRKPPLGGKPKYLYSKPIAARSREGSRVVRLPAR